MSTSTDQDDSYNSAIAQYGTALARLAVGYESNAERRRDLLQEIHIALWKSLANFDHRCSLRTWVYRVGHNVAINHVVREKRNSPVQTGLDELEDIAHPINTVDGIHQSNALERLHGMIQSLKTPDRQIMLLYLDDVDASSIGEIVGISANNVATRIYRIKLLLARNFNLHGSNTSTDGG